MHSMRVSENTTDKVEPFPEVAENRKDMIAGFWNYCRVE